MPRLGETLLGPRELQVAAASPHTLDAIIIMFPEKKMLVNASSMIEAVSAEPKRKSHQGVQKEKERQEDERSGIRTHAGFPMRIQENLVYQTKFNDNLSHTP
jgi:hypothetical protein